MKMLLKSMALVAVTGFAAISCGGSDSSDSQKPEGAVDGSLQVGVGEDAQSEAISFGGRSNVDDKGAFWVVLPGGFPQLVVIQSQGDEQLQAMAYVFPQPTGYSSLDHYTVGTSALTVDSRTTALALTMVNPLFFAATSVQKAALADAAVATAEFTALVNLLDRVYAADPAHALDFAYHPEVHHAAHDSSVAAAQSYATTFVERGGMQPQELGPDPDAAWIESRNGLDMVFRNPKLIYYAAGIEQGGVTGEPTLITPKDKVIDFSIWPPSIDIVDARETAVSTPAGASIVTIYKGIQFDMPAQQIWDTPAARLALLGNIWQTIVMTVSLAGDVGLLPDAGIGTDLLFGIIENTDFQLIYNIYTAVQTGDVMTIINAFVGFFQANSSTIASSVSGSSTDPSATSSLFSQVGNLTGIASSMFDVVNTEVPFYYDLITAHETAVYYINDGVVQPDSPSIIDIQRDWTDDVVDFVDDVNQTVNDAVDSVSGGGCSVAEGKVALDPALLLVVLLPLGFYARRKLFSRA